MIENSSIDKNSLLINIIKSLHYWALYILKKWYWICLFGIIGVLIGIAYAWFTPPKYTAVMSFSSEAEGQSKMGGYASLAASLGFDIGSGGNTFEGDNLVEFFKSKSLIETTLLTQVNINNKTTTLLEYYLRCRTKPELWNKDTVLNKMSFAATLPTPNRQRDSVIQKITTAFLKETLKVEKRDKKLAIIDASFMDMDEQFAKIFLETLTENAINYYTEYKIKKAKANVDLIAKQVDSVSGILRGNIVEVAAAQDLNVNPTRQIVRAGTQRKQVDVQANAAAYSELLKQLALAKLNLGKETPLIQIIDAQKYPLLKKKPGRLFTGIVFGFVFGVLGVLFLIMKNIYQQISAQIFRGASVS